MKMKVLSNIYKGLFCTLIGASSLTAAEWDVETSGTNGTIFGKATFVGDGKGDESQDFSNVNVYGLFGESSRYGIVTENQGRSMRVADYVATVHNSKEKWFESLKSHFSEKVESGFYYHGMFWNTETKKEYLDIVNTLGPVGNLPWYASMPRIAVNVSLDLSEITGGVIGGGTKAVIARQAFSPAVGASLAMPRADLIREQFQQEGKDDRVFVQYVTAEDPAVDGALDVTPNPYANSKSYRYFAYDETAWNYGSVIGDVDLLAVFGGWVPDTAKSRASGYKVYTDSEDIREKFGVTNFKVTLDSSAGTMKQNKVNIVCSCVTSQQESYTYASGTPSGLSKAVEGKAEGGGGGGAGCSCWTEAFLLKKYSQFRKAVEENNASAIRGWRAKINCYHDACKSNMEICVGQHVCDNMSCGRCTAWTGCLCNMGANNDPGSETVWGTDAEGNKVNLGTRPKEPSPGKGKPYVGYECTHNCGKIRETLNGTKVSRLGCSHCNGSGVINIIDTPVTLGVKCDAAKCGLCQTGSGEKLKKSCRCSRTAEEKLQDALKDAKDNLLAKQDALEAANKALNELDKDADDLTRHQAEYSRADAMAAVKEAEDAVNYAQRQLNAYQHNNARLELEISDQHERTLVNGLSLVASLWDAAEEEVSFSSLEERMAFEWMSCVRVKNEIATEAPNGCQDRKSVV